MKTIPFTLFSLLFLTLITSCSDDDAPEIINEEEVITDVTLTFVNEANETQTYTYTDPSYRDENYQEPVIMLKPGSTYQVELQFFNKSNPQDIEDITNEVREERNDHFVTYAFGQVAVDLTRNDSASGIDAAGIPIGLNTIWETQTAGNGTLVVKLIHEPTLKDVTNPMGSFTGGETDVEVAFQIQIGL